jgi:hypothetical protein
MSKDQTNLTTPSSSRAVIDAFLEKHAVQRHSGRGRMILAIDATASRKHCWDLAASLTAKMLQAAGGLPLDTQLVFYRGLNECQQSPWVSDARALTSLMKKVYCEAGETQIERILTHARKEDIKQKVAALVFIGDACEENPDTLAITARKLSLPCFMFQEGDEPEVTTIFANIARLTRGAHCRFDRGSAKQLVELLRAAAAYAAGGQQALKEISTTNAGAVRLLQQLR